MPKPLFVRVKHAVTGHEFDIREDSPLIASGRVKRVKEKNFPPTRVQRPPKHHVKLAGRTASRETGPAPAESEPQDAPAPAGEATEKE